MPTDFLSACRQNLSWALPADVSAPAAPPLIAALILAIACNPDVPPGRVEAPGPTGAIDQAATRSYPEVPARRLGSDSARWRALVVYTPNADSEYGEAVCSAFAQGLTWEDFGADLVAAGEAEAIFADYDLFVFCGDPLAEVGPAALERFADERLDLEYAPAVAIVTGPQPDLDELDALERALEERGAVLVGSAALGTPSPSLDGPEDGPSLGATLLEVERYGQSVGSGEFEADIPHDR